MLPGTGAIEEQDLSNPKPRQGGWGMVPKAFNITHAFSFVGHWFPLHFLETEAGSFF
jgi:hypothetical protein